jgi:hypothetical protein
VSIMFNAPGGLKRGDQVVVCADNDSFRTCDQICGAFGLKALCIAPGAGGGIDLARLQSALHADRHGQVRAVFVSQQAADAARDVIDLAWHDAALVIDSTVAGAA